MSALKMWFSTLQTKRLKKAVFLQDDQALKQYLNTNGRAKQVILCGNLIYSAMDKNSAPNESEAIAQPKRLRDGRDYQGKKGNWYLWIDKNVLRPNTIKRSSIFIAQDQYIAYGQKMSRNQPGRFMLVGGAAGSIETNVELYFFENGVLTAIEERILNSSLDSLAASGGMELLELIERRIDELTGSFTGELKVLVAAPLADYSTIESVSSAINARYVGKEPFERLIQPALYIPKDANALALSTQIKQWSLPVLIALTGAGASYYLVSDSMNNYSKAMANFNRAQSAQSPGIDNAKLALLQAKGVFLDELKDKQDYPYFADMIRILSAAGELPGIYISKIRLLGNPESRSLSLKAAAARGLDGGVPDLQLVLHLPLPKGFQGSLRDHSRVALEGISSLLHNHANAYRFTAFGHQQTKLLDGKQYNMFELRVTKTERQNAGGEW